MVWQDAVRPTDRRGHHLEGKDGMKPDDVTDGKQKTILAVGRYSMVAASNGPGQTI